MPFKFLLVRDPADHADPASPRDVAELLRALPLRGAAASLAVRAARLAQVSDPRAVAALLGTLCGADSHQAATTLATRAANAGMFNLYIKPARTKPAATRLAANPAERHADHGTGSSRLRTAPLTANRRSNPCRHRDRFQDEPVSPCRMLQIRNHAVSDSASMRSAGPRLSTTTTWP